MKTADGAKVTVGMTVYNLIGEPAQFDGWMDQDELFVWVRYPDGSRSAWHREEVASSPAAGRKIHIQHLEAYRSDLVTQLEETDQELAEVKAALATES